MCAPAQPTPSMFWETGRYGDLMSCKIGFVPIFGRPCTTIKCATLMLLYPNDCSVVRCDWHRIANKA